MTGVGLLLFDSEFEIPPGKEAVITTRPDGMFDSYRILVPSVLANSFSIEQIRVAGNHQLAAPPVPASAFKMNVPVDVLRVFGNQSERPAPVARDLARLGEPIMLDCSMAQPMEFQVKHVGEKPAPFVAALIGACAELDASGS